MWRGLIVSFLCLQLVACATSAKKREAEERLLNSANAHIELAFSYMDSGNMNAAFEQLGKSASIARINPQLDHGYAIYYQLQEDKNKSEQYFVAALQKNPKDPQINNNYGVLLSSLGRYEAAYLKFQAAYSDKNYLSRYSAYENYGDVAHLNGEHDKALEAYQKAVELRPSWFILQLKIARGYYNVAQFGEAYTYLTNYMKQVETLNLSPSKEGLELAIGISSAIKDYEALINYQRLLQDLGT